MYLRWTRNSSKSKTVQRTCEQHCLSLTTQGAILYITRSKCELHLEGIRLLAEGCRLPLSLTDETIAWQKGNTDCHGQHASAFYPDFA